MFVDLFNALVSRVIYFYFLFYTFVPPFAQLCARFKLATKIGLVADESDGNADCLRPRQRPVR